MIDEGSPSREKVRLKRAPPSGMPPHSLSGNSWFG